jgi:hypothetical protein
MMRVAFLAAAVATLPLAQAQGRIDSSFQTFWAADSPAAAAQAAGDILKSGVRLRTRCGG